MLHAVCSGQIVQCHEYYQEYDNKEGGRVSYPCVTAVVTVRDLLPYHLIQAVTFHTYTINSKRS